MTTSPSGSTELEVTQLSPSFNLPIAMIVIAILLFWVQSWLAGAIALFGIFLLFQAATLRLQFTDSALDIYRGDSLIRHFPYHDWQNWTIFWPPIPILFYFKEINSIHFLPVLFDAKALEACLIRYCSTSE